MFSDPFLHASLGVALLLFVPIITALVALVVFLFTKWLYHNPDDFHARCFAQATSFNTAIIPKLEAIRYNFPFYYNRHVGTCVPLGHDPEVSYERVVTTHPCGAQFAADWYPCAPRAAAEEEQSSPIRTRRKTDPDSASTPTSTSTSTPGAGAGADLRASTAGLLPRGLCVFVPGLCSNSDHKYVKQFSLHMAAKGYSTVVVTARGVGMPLATDSVWHPALTDDVHAVLLKQVPAGVPIFLVSFSAGTNIMRKLLVRLHDEGMLAPLKERQRCGVEVTPATTGTRMQLRRRTQARVRGSEPVREPDDDAPHRNTSSKKRVRGYADKSSCGRRSCGGGQGLESVEDKEGRQKPSMRVFAAFAVCVAGEDYEKARIFLESSHALTPSGDGVDSNTLRRLEQKQKQERVSCNGHGDGVWGHGQSWARLQELWELAMGLLWNLEGHLYSMLMTNLYKSIILLNPQVHGTGRLSEELVADVSRCATMSALDRGCNWRLFGYPSEKALMEDFSVNPADLRDKVDVPLLVIQPLDDPLHKSCPYHAIDVKMYTSNPRTIYTETSHGNHFGFYEGTTLSEAFQSSTSYTYPPKMADAFFTAATEWYETEPSPPSAVR